MLEGFSLGDHDSIVHTGLGQQAEEVQRPLRDKAPTTVKAGTYFEMKVVGKEVHVTFLPQAMEMLKKECTLSWVDWYRQ